MFAVVFMFSNSGNVITCSSSLKDYNCGCCKPVNKTATATEVVNCASLCTDGARHDSSVRALCQRSARKRSRALS